MVNVHLEKIFYHYIMENRELANIVKGRFFETDDMKKVYELSTAFIQKYGAPPTKSQIVELAKMEGMSEDLPASKVELIFETNLKEYDDAWLKESAHSWIEYKNLDLSVYDLISYLKTTKINAENITHVEQTENSINNDRKKKHF